MTRDLLVVGTGPAGLTAGLLAGRYGLDTTLFEREELGGELVNRHTIETYPGFPDGISGPDLRSRIVEQVRGYGLDLELAEVTGLDPGDPIALETAAGTYPGRAVILAGGGSPTPLSCPGGTEYEGRGVFYCAQCDGPLYTDKIVAVRGGGERAIADSLFLSDIASEVIVLEEGEGLSAPRVLCERARTTPNIEVRCHTEIAEVVGTDLLEGLALVDTETGEEYTEAMDGLLVQIGLDPNTGYLADTLSLTDTGAIAVDTRLATDVPGVFAAGAIREDAIYRVASAVGDGARAFESARAYLG